MDKLIKTISSYLKFLTTECNLSVSLHFDADFYSRIPEKSVRLIHPYNSHSTPYCLKVKSSKQKVCLENQREILKKCITSEGFLHTCHGGVKEFIYPLYREDMAVGYISVSGYKGTAPDFDFALWDSVLENDMPKSTIEATIPPLALMLEKLLSAPLTELDSEYTGILHFLEEYHVNVGLKELSEHFGKSKSHLSHLFKTKSGLSIRAYCNDLKLADSKTLLLTTNRSVTDIALDLGFSDTSHFIYLFKKKYGVSPLKYRKANM